MCEALASSSLAASASPSRIAGAVPSSATNRALSSPLLPATRASATHAAAPPSGSRRWPHSLRVTRSGSVAPHPPLAPSPRDAGRGMHIDSARWVPRFLLPARRGEGGRRACPVPDTGPDEGRSQRMKPRVHPVRGIGHAPSTLSHWLRRPSPAVGTLSPRCGEREAGRQCAMRTEIPSPRVAGRRWPKAG